MPKPDNVGVGVAILVISADDNRLLLLKRKGAHAANTYACPGGWIDFEDESPEAAAVRELKEELNLTVEEGELQPICNVSEYHPDLNMRTVTLYYRLRYIDWKHGIPKIGEPEKCSEMEWRYRFYWGQASDQGDIQLFPKLREVMKNY